MHTFFVKCGWTRNLLHQLTAKFNRFFRFLCLWTGIMQSQFVRSSTAPHIQAFIKLIKDVKGWYHLYKNNLHMYEGGQSISRLGIKEPLLWVHSKFKRQTLTQHFQYVEQTSGSDMSFFNENNKKIYFQSVFSNVSCHFLSISNNLVVEAFNIKNMYVNAICMQLNIKTKLGGDKIPVDRCKL